MVEISYIWWALISEEKNQDSHWGLSWNYRLHSRTRWDWQHLSHQYLNCVQEILCQSTTLIYPVTLACVLFSNPHKSTKLSMLAWFFYSFFFSNIFCFLCMCSCFRNILLHVWTWHIRNRQVVVGILITCQNRAFKSCSCCFRPFPWNTNSQKDK